MSTIKNEKAIMLAISVVNQAKSVLTKREYINAMAKAVYAEPAYDSKITLQECLFGTNHEEIGFKIELKEFTDCVWTNASAPAQVRNMFINSIIPNMIDDMDTGRLTPKETMKDIRSEWDNILNIWTPSTTDDH